MEVIAAWKGLQMETFDLTGAFLDAETYKPMYVQVPRCDLPHNKATLIRKVLYCTCSSGEVYSKEIKGWLTDYGF